MMTPKQLERLNAAFDFLLAGRRSGVTASEIIAGLVAVHGATFHKHRSNTNQLRCAGVTATCTWSYEEGLLSAWKNNALVRIMREAAE